MGGFDWVILALVAAGVVFGLVKGLARILVGLASLVVAFLLASHFRDPVGATLASAGVKPGPAAIAAYFLIFVATMLAGGLVAWLVGKLLKAAMLSWIDRAAGGALGLVAALLASAFVIHPIVASSSYGASLLRHSVLAPYVAVVADLANLGAPKEISEKYRKEIDVLRKLWRGEALPPQPEKLPAPTEGKGKSVRV